MRTDAIAVQLRPRNDWEAIDLGLELGRAWFVPLAVTWSVAYLAPALLVVACAPWPLAAAAVVWLLRPWAERALIETLAARCFDRRLTLGEALRAVGRAPRRPLAWLASLTWRRFSAVRFAWLAVWQLEGLHGPAARARVRVLTAQGRGACAWAMLLGTAATALLTISGVVVALALVPDGTGTEAFAWLDGTVPMPLREARTWALVLVAADAVCAPWVLAAQFGWYIHRRTDLEAWDIELVFRALSRRLLGAASLLVTLLLLSSTALAQDSSPPRPFDANAVVDGILAQPEFGRQDIVQQWRLREWQRGEARPDAPWMLWLLDRIPAIATALRWAMWAAALAIVGWLLRLSLRAAGRRAPREDEPMPMEFEAGAERLAHVQVASAASHAVDEGRLLDALALLYRGAIGVCSDRGLVDDHPGDTEGEYLRQVAGRLAPDAERTVRRVVRAWQAAAYARRLPSVDEARSMIDAYQLHVAGGDA